MQLTRPGCDCGYLGAELLIGRSLWTLVERIIHSRTLGVSRDVSREPSRCRRLEVALIIRIRMDGLSRIVGRARRSDQLYCTRAESRDVFVCRARDRPRGNVNAPRRRVSDVRLTQQWSETAKDNKRVCTSRDDLTRVLMLDGDSAESLFSLFSRCPEKCSSW